MAAEMRPFFGQLAPVGQAENLKAARVGQDRAVPAVEAVETSGTLENFGSGPQIEVVGIAQNDLRLYVVAELVAVDGLDRPDRAHGHEDRCGDSAVVGRDNPGAGRRRCRCCL